MNIRLAIRIATVACISVTIINIITDIASIITIVASITSCGVVRRLRGSAVLVAPLSCYACCLVAQFFVLHSYRYVYRSASCRTWGAAS